MASDKQKTEALRRAITLKNLRRHDDEITDIVAQSPFAVVYYSSVDDNNDFVWQKSNIEGPMFIFKRSQAPFYGFMILNHKGLEYIHQLLTPELDAVSEEGMIMFRTSVNEESATGIWVQDDDDRKWMFTKMEQLRLSTLIPPTAPVPPPPAPPAPAPTAAPTIAYNQSIPLDILFASTSLTSPIPPPATLPPPQPQTGPSQPSGLTLLDSIFKSVQPAPLPLPLPTAPKPPPMDARALLAMIGHPGGVPAPAPPPPPPAPTTTTTTATPAPAPGGGGPKPLFAPPLLSHDLFSLPVPRRQKGPADASPPKPQVPPPNSIPTAAVPVSNPTPTKPKQVTPPPPPPAAATTQLSRKFVSPILNDALTRAATGMSNGNSSAHHEPLNKAQFMRAISELLQKPAFSTSLYSKYLARFSAQQEQDEGEGEGGKGG